MTKLILSGLLTICAFSGLLFSPSVMACQDGGSGRCGDVGFTGNRDNSLHSGGGGYSSSGTSRSTVYTGNIYGAFVVSQQAGQLFHKANYTSKRAANEGVLKLCQQTGANDCQLIYSFKNTCIFVSSGATAKGQQMYFYDRMKRSNLRNLGVLPPEDAAVQLCQKEAQNCFFVTKQCA